MAIEKGRSTRPDLKVGICGEHGGEATSVKFCHKVGMNYVSCSPFRVPICTSCRRPGCDCRRLLQRQVQKQKEISTDTAAYSI
jgi:phosphoenolpyruvate-protein kinase (PTS system EI component)